MSINLKCDAKFQNYVSENGHIFTTMKKTLANVLGCIYLMFISYKKCGNINNNFYLAPKYYGAKWHPFLILCLIKLIFFKA